MKFVNTFFVLEHAAPDKEDFGFDARGVEFACDNVQGGVGAALFATATVKQEDFHDKLRCVKFVDQLPLRILHT